MPINRKYVGSSIESFFEEMGELEEVRAMARKKVEEMAHEKVTVLMGDKPVEVPLNSPAPGLRLDVQAQWEEEMKNTPLTVPAEEIWAFIKGVETGEITLKFDPHPKAEHPQDVYCGWPKYTASNGWKIVIFNDCNAWDYFEEFELPDGRKVDYLQLPDDLAEYRPSDGVAWVRYGIPGYRVRRCRTCGTVLVNQADSFCAEHLP